MQPDTELDTWRRQWQAHDAVAPDLIRRVEREIRVGRLRLVAAIAVTVIFGGGVPIRMITSQRVDDVVLAIGVWIFIAITWLVSWSLNRGASRPLASTTIAFLEFSILTCRRGRDAIAAAAVLYAMFLTFVLAWQYHGASQGAPLALWSFLTSPKNLAVWAVSAALAALSLWRRRKLTHEMKSLEYLRERLEKSNR